MFRGLAVLTQDPSRRDSEQIAPVTGEMFSDNDNAVHMIQKPFKVKRSTPVVAGQSVLSALPGVRYFIHSCSYSLFNAAAEATTYMSLRLTSGGTIYNAVTVAVQPSVAATYNGSVILDILTDENTDVKGYMGIVDPAGICYITITYGEVGGSIGG